jgi:hypothetical protein
MEWVEYNGKLVTSILVIPRAIVKGFFHDYTRVLYYRAIVSKFMDGKVRVYSLGDIWYNLYNSIANIPLVFGSIAIIL